MRSVLTNGIIVIILFTVNEFAARHFRRDRKFLESQLDQRIGPAPDHRRREGENGHPKWPLKQADRLRLLFFHRMHLVLKTLRMSHKAKHTKHKGSL